MCKDASAASSCFRCTKTVLIFILQTGTCYHIILTYIIIINLQGKIIQPFTALYTVKRKADWRNLLGFFTLPHRQTICRSSRNPLKRGSSLSNHPGFLRNSNIRHCVEPLWVPPGTNFYLCIIISCCYYGYHYYNKQTEPNTK